MELFHQAATDNSNGEPAILASAATGIVDRINVCGGDIDSIFGNSGIAPCMAGSPTLKLQLSSFCRLFEEASRQTGEGNFGLWFGNKFKPRDLGLWGYSAISAPTLGVALGNLVDLFKYHQESSMLRVAKGDDGMMRFEYQIKASDIIERRQDAELSLGMFLNIFRECMSRSWAPEEVHFEHPEPADWRAHQSAFQAPVYFSQPANALLFRPEILDTPMPGRDLTLMTMMRTCLERLGGPVETYETVHDWVINTVRLKLPDGYPSLEKISDELQLSPATIQRELSRDGTDFRSLVEIVRKELATVYLQQRHLQFSEIALLLGYSELSAFSRAVKRWTGQSPSAVRAHYMRV
jgi:AraC-like DNA-binding protein